VGAKLILRVVLVLVAAALVAGAGYLKFRSLRKIRIKNAVVEKLKAAPSETLRGSDLRVWVSDDREVTLDGAVRGAEDFTLAGSLAGSVPGVAHVRNRLIVVPTETSDSLINKGVTFLDAGDYSSAIDCFRKASADPNNRAAKDLLTRRCERSRPKKNYLRTGSNVLPVGASAETSVSQFLAVNIRENRTDHFRIAFQAISLTVVRTLVGPGSDGEVGRERTVSCKRDLFRSRSPVAIRTRFFSSYPSITTFICHAAALAAHT